MQFEDEIGSMASILGASWAGVKSMTASSGPGISLMLENIGLGIMMETPCVVVNVQRGSPSTGLPTSWGQSDMMQARFGSHGDYGVIALAPKSPQEYYDLTIVAFNYAEKYRLPVFVTSDAIVGHMTEKVYIPPVEELEIIDRKYTTKKPSEYQPYTIEPGQWVSDFAKAGDGYLYHSTGLTHDERGYPDMSEACHVQLVNRLIDKIKLNVNDIILLEERDLDDADVVEMGALEQSNARKINRASLFTFEIEDLYDGLCVLHVICDYLATDQADAIEDIDGFCDDLPPVFRVRVVDVDCDQAIARVLQE